MVTAQGIVIAYGAACLRSVLVIIEDVVGEVGQLAKVLLDVQDVRVEVKVLVPVGISLE